MVGIMRLFRKRLTGSKLVEKHFWEVAEKLSGADEIYIASAANSVTLLWNIFNARYDKNAEAFINSSHDERDLFLDQITKIVEKIASNEIRDDAPQGSLVGAFLAQWYFVALAHHHDVPNLVNEIADFIEPLHKIGFEIHKSLGMSETDPEYRAQAAKAWEMATKWKLKKAGSTK